MQLAVKRDLPDQLEQIEETPHFIEGEIDDFVVVSVPESMTPELMDKFHQRAMDALGRPVLVVTHNVTFLKAVKMSSKYGAQLLKKVQDADSQSSDSDEEELGGVEGAEGLGSGSGVCEVGDSGAVEGGHSTAEDVGDADSGDGKISEEGDEGDASVCG